MYAPHTCHLIIEFIRRIFSERPKQTDVALQYNELIPVSKYIETVIGERGQRESPVTWEVQELKDISPSASEIQAWFESIIESLTHTGPDGEGKIAILDFLEKVLAFATARTLAHHVELQSMFKELDEDGSGHLSFEEFKSLSTKRLLNIPKTEKGMLKLFNKINSLDDDPDDLVDPSVFSTVLIRKGVFPTNPVSVPLSRASVKAMMKFSAASAGVQSSSENIEDEKDLASKNENDNSSSVPASNAHTIFKKSSPVSPTDVTE